MVKLDQLVALVGEGGAGLLEVASDLGLAVVDVARRDQLVARMLEGRHRRVELVAVLRLHVLDDELLASVAQGLGQGHARDSNGGGARLVSDARWH